MEGFPFLILVRLVQRRLSLNGNVKNPIKIMYTNAKQ